MKLKNGCTGFSLPFIFKRYHLLPACILLALLLIHNRLSAQEDIPSSVMNSPNTALSTSVLAGIPESGLNIGDEIPEEIWNLPLQVVGAPDDEKVIRLNDYKGRLIILDFWATWCGSCINAMPVIHQEALPFGEKIIILPVSADPPQPIRRVLLKNPLVKDLHLSSVVSDKILKKAFPHLTVPHYAWIGPSGKLIATTGHKDINAVNIKKALSGGDPDYALKTYIDTDQPLLLQADKLPQGATIAQYALFIKGKIPSLPSGGKLRRSADKVSGLVIYNRPVGSMYYSMASRIRPEGFSGKRMVFEVDTLLHPEINYRAFGREKIPDSLLCTYEFRMPENTADSLFYLMLNGLNDVSGYHGRWVKRKQPCLVLQIADQSRFTDLMTKGGKSNVALTGEGYEVVNMPFSWLINFLDREAISGHNIVLNETGSQSPIDIKLSIPEKDPRDWPAILKNHGLQLAKSERVVDVFVITGPVEKGLSEPNKLTSLSHTSR